MTTFLDRFGGKESGHLIKADDWNNLLIAIDALEKQVGDRFDQVETKFGERFRQIDGRIDAVDGRVAELDQAVTKLGDGLSKLEKSVTPLIGEFLRLRLSTPRLRFAIGQLAEIEARVTGLDGKRPDLSDPAKRPFVDFVTNWGQLKPVRGFESRGGVGDKTISVKVNAEGVAKVQVRAEHTEELPEEVEEGMNTALGTRVSATKTVSTHLLEAATPMEASEGKAFKLMAKEYEREDALAVRNYVDAYFLRNAPIIQAPFFRRSFQGWRDYRSTVLAVVKDDSDPRTPDQGRGVASIQITFRDWIGPFIMIDYLKQREQLVDRIKRQFSSDLGPSLELSMRNFQKRVIEVNKGQGLVARHRGYRAIADALDELETDAERPVFFGTLKSSVKDAVSLQLALERPQMAATGAAGEVAVEALTNSVLRSDVDRARLEMELSRIDKASQERAEKVEQVAKDFESLDDNVKELDRRAKNIDQRTQGFAVEVNSVKNSLGNLKSLNVGEVAEGIGHIKAHAIRLEQLESKVNR